MQLCEKLCQKLFYSKFGKLDYEGNAEVPNVQLICSTKTPSEVHTPKESCQVPSVNVIQPTPKPSPSKLNPEEESKIVTAEDNIPETQGHEDLHKEPEYVKPCVTFKDLDAADTCDQPLETRSPQNLVLKATVNDPEDGLPQEISMEDIMFIGGDDLLDLEASPVTDLRVGPEGEVGDNESTSPTDSADEDFEFMDDSSKRLATKYGDLGGELILLDLPNPRTSKCALGLRLSGNKDLNTMSVFICQIISNSLADIDGRLKVGDEILEIDEHILYGRSHLNASPIISSCSDEAIKFVIHRSAKAFIEMAIPVSYVPVEECDSRSSSRRNSIMDYLNDNDNNHTKKRFSVSSEHTPTGTPLISTEESHTIYLERGAQGYGFAIMAGSFTNEEGIFIKHLAPSGPAAQDGSLRAGDRLVSINHHNVLTASYDTALDLLKHAKGQIRLVVTRVRCAHSPTHEVHSPVKTTYQKRLSAPHIFVPQSFSRPPSTTSTIVEEVPEPHHRGISITTIPESESGLTKIAKTMTDLNARRRSSLSLLPSADVVTMIFSHLTDDEHVETVNIARDNHPLGISIIGGSDTFIGDVIVHDIFPKGIVATDGRVKVGDRILMINESSVVDCRHDEVLTMLQSSCPVINLKVRHPEVPIHDQDIYEEVTTVELTKRPSKGLGISVIGREGANGVYVCDILKGGVADVDGHLEPGDQILEINGVDLRNSSQEAAASILKYLIGPIIFKIGRIQRMNLHYTPTYLLAKDENGNHIHFLGKHLMPNGHGQASSRLNPAHAR